MRGKSYRNVNNSQPNNIRGGETKVMKKLVNALLVFVLVFALAMPAFAANAPLSDVVGTKYESAVNELAALNILSGYPDGTFKADNNITRAEFAKVIVLATGNDTMVKYLENSTTPFSDVKVGDWYNGFVAAAAAKGFLKGYPDGTFKPNANITYQEVLTVLVRALGYDDDKLPGSWPFDILIKADDLGLMSGVDVDAAAPAPRGDVAIMTATTIEKPTIKYDSNGDEILDANGDATGDALIKLLGAGTDSGVLDGTDLTGTNKDTLDLVDANKTLKVADGYTITGGKTLADLLGHELSFVLNTDGDVIVISDVQDSAKVKSGKLEVAFTETSNKVDLVDEDAIDIASPVLFLNGEKVTASTYTIPKDADVTLYLDDASKVRFIVANNYDVTNDFFKSFSAATSYRDAKLTTNNNTYNVVDDAVITKDGKAATLADLVDGDILDLQLNSAGKVTALRATTPVTMTGKVTSTITKDSTTYYVVGGVQYTAVDGVTPSLDVEYNFVLNGDNVIVDATQVDNTSDSTVIVVSSTPKQILKDNVITDVYETTLFNVSTGKSTVYYDTYDLTAKVGDFGDVTFDDQGAISGFTTTKDVTATASKVTSFDSDTITVDGTTYAVTNDTVFVNLLDTDNKLAPSLMSFSDLQDNAMIYYTFTGYNLDYVFVEDGGSASVSAVPVVTGYVTGATATTDSNGTTYTATLNVNGVSKEITVPAAATTKQLVRYADADSNGTVDGKYNAPTVAVSLDGSLGSDNTLLEVTNNVIEDTYLATSSTVVYVVDADGNVSVGDLADVADLDGATVGTDVASVSVLTAKVLDSNDQPTATDKTLGSYKVLEAILINLK